MTNLSSNLGPSRLWTVDFVLNLLTAHFMFASYTSLFTTIPPYVLAKGGEEWHIGIVIGAFGVAAVVLRPFAGRWTYVIGPKWIAFSGALIFAIAALLYIPAENVWFIIPARVLQGIGLAVSPVATSTVVANLAPTRRRGEAMGYMGNSISTATVYSPVLGFWLLQQAGFEASFFYTGATALLSALFALALSSKRIGFSEAPGNEATAKVPLISRSALFPTMVFMSYTITTAPVNTFLPILAVERNLGNPGLYFTVHSLTNMVAMLFSGAIADRVGRPAVIAPGLAVAAAAMFVVMYASSQPMVLAAGVLSGLGFGFLQPGMQSFTIDRAPPRERSAAMATLQQAWDIGGSGGAFVVGPIAGIIGIGATFGLTGVGALGGAAAFLASIARQRHRKSETHEGGPANA